MAPWNGVRAFGSAVRRIPPQAPQHVALLARGARARTRTGIPPDAARRRFRAPRHDAARGAARRPARARRCRAAPRSAIATRGRSCGSTSSVGTFPTRCARSAGRRAFTAVAVADAGARHRRQHRHLQRGTRRPPAAAAVSRDASRIVRIWEHVPAQAPNGGTRRIGGMNVREFLEVQARSRTLSHVMSFGQLRTTTLGGAEAARLRQDSASPAAMFPMLGVQPAIGRWFTREEGTPGKNNVIILSDDGWRRFGARSESILGQVITFTGDTNNPMFQGVAANRGYTVVGVMPARVPVSLRRRPGLGPSHTGTRDPTTARPGRRRLRGWQMGSAELAAAEIRRNQPGGERRHILFGRHGTRRLPTF